MGKFVANMNNFTVNVHKILQSTAIIAAG